MAGRLSPRALKRGSSVLFAGWLLVACKESTPPVPVASLSPLPAVDSMVVGTTRTLTVQPLDADGRALNRKVTFVSATPAVATVTGDGEVSALGIGSTRITASAEGKTTETLMTVQPAVHTVIVSPTDFTIQVGATRQLTVTPNDVNGLPLPGRLVTYSSSRPEIATVTVSGVVAAVAVGRATITATSGGKSGLATVDVIPVQVTSVTISPAGAQTINQGSTLQLQATARDANGVILSGRSASWSTANPAVASVSESGLVTGVSLGSTQITADIEGRTASAQITVTPRAFATISLSPNPASVSVGGQIQMTVDLRDAGGNPLSLDGRSVNWQSSNQPVATVTGGGVVAGNSVGSAVITVTVDGRPASATVNVTGS